MNNFKMCEKNPYLDHIKNRNLGCFRIVHAHPGAPNADIYLNDKLIAENLTYCSYTNYFPMCCGDFKLSINITGSKKPPMVVDLLKIEDNEMQTLSLIKTYYKAGLIKNIDYPTSSKANMSMVRFVHLSPDTPPVDITLPDGTILFENVSYQQSTPYLSVLPATYTLEARVTGTPDVVLTIPNVALEPNKSYSVNAIGLINGMPELESLILLDEYY